MKSSLVRKLFAAAALLMAGASALAEDIDVYAGNNTSATSNLLLVIDNSGAWNASATTSSTVPANDCPTSGTGQILDPTLANSSGGVETCGIWKAVDAIGKTPVLLGKLNMGLMLFSKGSVQGGTFKYPAVAAPTALPNMNATGIANMKVQLTALQSSGPGSQTANGTDVGGSMQEAWAFYTGKTGMSGTTYSGISADTCGKNFVIFIGISRVSSDPADSNANNVLSALSSAGATTEQKTYINWTVNNKYSKATNYWGDEWTRFSKQNNAITTYTITLVDNSNPNPDYERFMKSMADASGGRAFVVDVNDMQAFVQALLQIFNEVQAVNSVFAAASLPISTNATGSFLNQIYFGMFRPDPGGLPRWAGNLKQYQFKGDFSDPLHPRLFLADSLGVAAISSAGTGFFSPNAISFWTTKDITTAPDNIDPTGALGINGGTPGGYFINNPQSAGEGFDSPDGEVVEKGGVAQRIRLENLINNYANAPGTSGNPRRLYTCTSGAGSTPDCGAGSLLSDTPFALTNNDLTDANLGTGAPPTAISTLTRNDVTATVTTAAAMSPVLADGQKVTISGTSYPQYNGVVTAGGPPTATVFTFPVAVGPPATATGGGYVVSTPGFAVPVVATSIVRVGDNAIVTIPSNTHVANDTVIISGAGGAFDKTATVLASPAPTATTFAYALTITPGNSTGGTAKKTAAGATGTIASMTRATADPTTFYANVVVEMTNNVPSSGTASATTNWQVGNTITFAGTTGAAYDGDYVITSLGTGNSGVCQGNPSGKRFCISVLTKPGTATTPATVSTPGSSATITGITRGTSCTGGTPVQTATATATTSAAHSFTSGTSISIGGGDAASVPYTGNFTVLASPAPTATTFSYTITTDLPCSDATAGKTVAVGGTDRTTLINWMRGADIGDEPGPGGSINIRPSVHGDVLHSRPAIINYGGTIGVVAFYGANDGTLRAVNGNQTAAIVNGSVSVPAGGELWGFIAPEHFTKLTRQFLNTPVVKLESTPTSILPSPQPKDYFFDGSIGVYKNGSTVHLYVSVRRGGRILYALDVSNPASPRFMWKKTNASAGFGELGQTWSTPRVAKVKGYSNPVLIFGAGYDPAEDVEPPAARTMGRGIFILDALDGSIVWQANGGGSSNTCTGTPCSLLDMTYPIPADIALVNADDSDLLTTIDRLYAPDLGGNVWRVDLEPSTGNAPANWTVTKFAAVGGAAADTTKRKIFFPPDVARIETYDAVMFATGDREHPTRTQAAVNIINRFYMLKDTIGPNGSTTTIADSTSNTANTVPTGLFNASSVLPTTASAIPATVGQPYDQTGNGFYLTLLNAVAHKQTDGSVLYGPDTETGEKSVNAPTSIGGNVFWGTNTPIPPDPTVCQPNLGVARGYAVNLLTGVFNFAQFDGGGLPPSPVAGLVVVDGRTVPFLIGGAPPQQGTTGSAIGTGGGSPLSGSGGPIGGATVPCNSAICGSEITINIKALRTRSYWYRDIGNR